MGIGISNTYNQKQFMYRICKEFLNFRKTGKLPKKSVNFDTSLRKI